MRQYITIYVDCCIGPLFSGVLVTLKFSFIFLKLHIQFLKLDFCFLKFFVSFLNSQFIFLNLIFRFLNLDFRFLKQDAIFLNSGVKRCSGTITTILVETRVNSSVYNSRGVNCARELQAKSTSNQREKHEHIKCRVYSYGNSATGMTCAIPRSIPSLQPKGFQQFCA